MDKNKKTKTTSKIKKENLILLKFLRKTKKGGYGPVESSSMPYVRLEEAVEVYGDEESYYFGLS